MHHLPGLQFLAAQADDQSLAPQVRITRQVAHSADRDIRIRCGDRHAAAVTVGQRHHVIDVRVIGQQFVLDTLDRMVQHAGNALHGGGDTENIACAHGAVGVAIALEGKAFQWRLGVRHFSGQRQAVQRWRGGHAQLVFLHPTAPRNRRQGVTDGLAIANNLTALRDIFQRHLVALRDEIHGHQAVRKLGPGRYALVVDHDHHVVTLVQTDRARRVGMFNQLHYIAPQECASVNLVSSGPLLGGSLSTTRLIGPTITR